MKLKTKKTQVVQVQDWDDLVQETYGKIYSFQQQDDCKDRGTIFINIPSEPCDFENDTVPEVINGEEMGVSFKAWLERDPNEWNGIVSHRSFIQLFWTRNFYPDVQMIANDLHARGLVDAGEYAIEIDW
jgi:hypothetical protein